MPRSKKEKRELTTIKIDLDIAVQARAVVGLEGGELTDLYSEILRPAVQARYEKAIREANKRIAKVLDK